MKTNTSNTDAHALLEVVERLAVRAYDAPLALAALSARHHPDSIGCAAGLLSQLARFAGDRASVVIENGRRAASAQREWGVDAAALLSRGWVLFEAFEREGSR